MTRDEHPDKRAYRLATEYAEEFIRGNGIPFDAADHFVFHGAALADFWSN